MSNGYGSQAKNEKFATKCPRFKEKNPKLRFITTLDTTGFI
jgi:hypothetical protein